MKYLLEPGVRHIMIDIETLDVTTDAPILSIAAMPFWLTAEEEIDFLNSKSAEILCEHFTFKRFVELPPRIPNNDTFQWHVKEKTGAIENSVKYGQHLDAVLFDLDDYVAMWAEWNDAWPDTKNKDYFIWGWGYGFDMTILTTAYRSLGPRRYKMDEPKAVMIPKWLSVYWRLIDARSVFFSHGGIWDEYSKGRQGQHHDPLDDVKHQIKTIQGIFQRET